MQIEISNPKRYKISKESMADLVKNFLQRIKIDNVQVSIHIVTLAKIRQLNKNFRKIDKVTDVLSFPQIKNIRELVKLKLPNRPLGDVFICHEQAVRQAKENNRTVKNELLFLVEHGLKHLAGIHHK